MLDPQVLRNDIEQVAKALTKRDFTLDIAAIETLEEKRKAIQVKTQARKTKEAWMNLLRTTNSSFLKY